MRHRRPSSSIECIARTIETELPDEADFLRRFDNFRSDIERVVEMPERVLDMLLRFLRQNGGRLSARAREREFAALSRDEIELVEDSYRRSFAD